MRLADEHREQGGRHFPSPTLLPGFGVHCTVCPPPYMQRGGQRFTPAPCLQGTPGGEDPLAGTAAPRVQDQPTAESRRELADPAVPKWGRSRCSLACSQRTRQLFAAGGCRQMPSSRPSQRAAGVSKGRLSSYPPPALSQPCPDEPGGFPTSSPPSRAMSLAHTLPSPALFPTSPGMPLRSCPLSGQEGAGRLGAGARQSRSQKSSQPRRDRNAPPLSRSRGPSAQF